MKKKTAIILPIIILVDLLIIINPVNGFNCYLLNLETDQTDYYIDQYIEIKASWELLYNPINEIAYIQIHIMDSSNNIIWNSSKINQIGINSQNWTTHIEELNLDFNNESLILFIKFFLFYFQIDTTNTMYTYLETIKIKIMKRSISCDLNGFKDRIKLGENLSFTAKFYTESLENIINLTDQKIQFKVSFNQEIIYYINYTTNNLGIIKPNISSLTHLKLGLNFLIFLVTNNRVFNDSKFIFEIYVEKNSIFIDVLNFSEILKKDEDLEVSLLFYYYLNKSMKYLANFSILLSILDNNTIVFIKKYKTDDFGFLAIKLSQELFYFSQESQQFIINVFFNGTYFLDNKTLSLNLNIDPSIDLRIKDSFQVNFLSFLSIFVLIFILFSYIITNKRSKNEKLLTELIVRY